MQGCIDSAEVWHDGRYFLDVLDVSVAEWLACWTQAQKGPGSDRVHDTVG